MDRECCSNHELTQYRIAAMEKAVTDMCGHFQQIRSDIGVMREIVTSLKDFRVVERVTTLEQSRKAILWLCGVIGSAAATIVGLILGD